MIPRLPISDFWHSLQVDHTPVIDVRSPQEFLHGHIPGAVNIPLFDDEERAAVGTLYKQVSRDAAILRGLELVGPKLAAFVRQVREVAPGGTILVHCWRGGMRSEYMALLWQTTGMKVATLQGGYKAYRQSVLATMARPWKLRILGGATGSGKTACLQAIADQGGQILDLEALAHHKGSSFGSLGQLPQPTTEQFENDLHARLMCLDPDQPVWVEDESVSIGKVFIPKPFWDQMCASPAVILEIPQEVRIRHLVQEYAAHDPSEMEAALARISRRLGGLQYQRALEAYRAGDLEESTRIVLAYYDKAYTFAISLKPQHLVTRLTVAQDDAPATARTVLRISQPH
ncbi:MAG: tRNA 2-selenouridine(34) synthase MnmH [Bacteroidia bacterium]|nr:tRNA 2-selenouridine(34) synthase MnmH [Bacteroidia bacterium]